MYIYIDTHVKYLSRIGELVRGGTKRGGGCEAHAAGMRIAGGLVVQRLLAN